APDHGDRGRPAVRSHPGPARRPDRPGAGHGAGVRGQGDVDPEPGVQLAMRADLRAAVIAAALALPLAAGGAKTGIGPGGPTDARCGAAAWVSGSCVARATAPAGWGIELQPRTDEPVAALTEAFVPDSGSLDLMAAGRVTVSGTFSPAQSALAPMAGHVVLTV